MLLTFKMDITNITDVQKNIIKDLCWHVEKVYNTLLYEIRESKREIDLNKSLNILSSGIYKEYRETKWRD